MSAFDELYQEVILDHYRHPRGATPPEKVVGRRVHENPTCGDSISMKVDLDADGKIGEIAFAAAGCAISVASASLMTEALRGKPVAEAARMVDDFLAIMRGEAPVEGLDRVGDLAALGGVAGFPARIKCATLAWHALLAELESPRMD